MKLNKTFTALVIGLASAAVTQALPPGPLVTPNNPVFISGSTAFRAQVYQGLLDLGLTNQPGDSSGNNIFTFGGTPTNNKVAGLPAGLLSGPCTVYCSFDGSAQGVNECVNTSLAQNFEDLGPTAAAGTATFTHASDLAFSDVSQSSTAYPSSPALNELVASIAQSSHLGTGIAVQPFLWAGNTNASNIISTINDGQIFDLFKLGQLPLSYWTGNPGDTNVIKLTGRDNTSGTRITSQQLAAWNAALPINQWTVDGGVGTPNTAGNTGPWTAVANSGYGSGGNVAKALGELGVPTSDTSAVVGYISFADAKGLVDTAALNGGTVAGIALTYNNVNPILTPAGGTNVFAYNIAAVENGPWFDWSYEHLYESLNYGNAVSGGNGGFVDASFGPGLVLAVDYEIGLQGVSVFPQTAILINNMNVKRTTDGGPLLPFVP